MVSSRALEPSFTPPPLVLALVWWLSIHTRVDRRWSSDQTRPDLCSVAQLCTGLAGLLDPKLVLHGSLPGSDPCRPGTPARAAGLEMLWPGCFSWPSADVLNTFVSPQRSSVLC